MFVSTALQPPYIFCAIDTQDQDRALSLAGMMARAGCGIKLGLEYFNKNGPDGIRTVTARYPDLPFFLDLKFHDIPHTVAGAVSAVTALGASYINVHATGGRAMMEAAREAAEKTAARHDVPTPRILAVTLLTSLDEQAVNDVGFTGTIKDRVVHLAKLAEDSGMDGVVCSAHEIEHIRQNCGPDFVLMVPGIRPAGEDAGDQRRIMTPVEALAKGASHLVIGRPITQAADPESAARRINAEIVQSLPQEDGISDRISL